MMQALQQCILSFYVELKTFQKNMLHLDWQFLCSTFYLVAVFVGPQHGVAAVAIHSQI